MLVPIAQRVSWSLARDLSRLQKYPVGGGFWRIYPVLASRNESRANGRAWFDRPRFVAPL